MNDLITNILIFIGTLTFWILAGVVTYNHMNTDTFLRVLLWLLIWQVVTFIIDLIWTLLLILIFTIFDS